MRAMSDTISAWSTAAAKARFSELIERARIEGPQTVTRNGREAVVVVSVEDWRRRTGREGRLGDYLAASPLRGSGLDMARPRIRGRDIELS